MLWDQDGSVTNIPCTLPDCLKGDAGDNVAGSINNRGEVVGTALFTDGVHAFRWTRETGMQDFGIFSGTVATVAPCCRSINNRGEVVGFAIDPMGNSCALVWQGKTPVDLNNFIPQNSALYLQASESVNDAGQIAGVAVVKSSCPVATPPAWLTNQGACTEVHAFLASPMGR